MKSPALWLAFVLLAIVAVTALGPVEKTLGTNVRAVYLHGAWVWTALFCFLAAAGVGLLGLLIKRQSLHYWSRALGRTGLVFWITYLPLSLWAMQANWNGLFLVEPRWRVAMIFAIGGLVLQAGITLLENPAWASTLNLVYALILVYVLQTTEQVMHPNSPIFGSGAWHIQVYFVALTALTMLAAWQLVRWWRGTKTPSKVQTTPTDG